MSENGSIPDDADSLRGAVDEFQKVVLGAIDALRNIVIEHYQRTTTRLDEHARRIRVIEERIGITRPPPGDGL